MKLKILKNREIKPKMIIILGIIVISLIGMIIYQSYALFKLNESHNIVDSEVGTFSTGDIKILSVYVDGEKVNTFPTKNDDKIYEKIECTNSGVGEWDAVNWKLTVSDITEPTSCNVYFIINTGPFPGVKQTVISGNIYVDYDTNMIPVAYTLTGATVKADTTNTDSTYKWFDYTQYRWANAVLVTDSSREAYKNATTGTVVAENDILGYFVYIPRYRYQLFNAGNSTIAVQSINIAFENKSTIKSTGSTNGAWLTHPAFTFGSTELNGIWVGKFETSPEEGNTCYTASSVANCDLTSLTPRIKPNKNSWGFISVSNMFTVSQYFRANSMYGISTSVIDAHMIKNMEWGAVAYLSQSQYGKRGNTGSSMYGNNYMLSSSSYYNTLTGCSSGMLTYSAVTACTYPYPNTTTGGVGASTSGTIYGVYDMSGGAYEYVMGNMASSSANYSAHVMNVGGGGTVFGNYTNVTLPKKYFDIYNYGVTNFNQNAAARGKLGDATRETLDSGRCSEFNCSWDAANSSFVHSTHTWFVRGSAANTIAGIFAFDSRTGEPGYFVDNNTSYYMKISSRVILAVE